MSDNQQQPPKISWYKRPIRMQLWLFLVILVIVLAIGAGIGEGSAAAPTATTPITNTASTPAAPTATPVPPTPTPTPKPLTFQVTHTYTGNGNKKTETFTIAGNDWKVDWSCNPSSSFGGQYNIIVDVNNSDNTPMDPGAINTICSTGNTSGTTEEHQGGTFYLDVQSEAAWTIKIDELQ